MTTEFDTYERDLWAGSAADYQRVFMQQSRYMAGPILDAAGVTQGVRVLDVGTGPGPVAGEAVARGAQVTAVDAEPGMVEIAARNVPQAEVLHGLLPDLGLKERSFQAVVGNFVINHVGAPDAAVAALRELLEPDGRLALTCWHHVHSAGLGLVQRAMEEVGLQWPDDLPFAPFSELGEPAPFGALLRDAGLRDVAVEEVRWEHVVDPEVWWSGPASGVGTNGVVLGRLDEATRERVKAAYMELVRPYATGDGHVALSACALLASGRR